MKVRVQFMAQLRSAIGRGDELLDLAEASTVAEVVRRLAETQGAEAARHLLTPAGAIQPSLLIAVNGAAVPVAKRSDLTLHDGDTLALLPPIAGG